MRDAGVHFEWAAVHVAWRFEHTPVSEARRDVRFVCGDKPHWQEGVNNYGPSESASSLIQLSHSCTIWGKLLIEISSCAVFTLSRNTFFTERGGFSLSLLSVSYQLGQHSIGNDSRTYFQYWFLFGLPEARPPRLRDGTTGDRTQYCVRAT